MNEVFSGSDAYLQPYSPTFGRVDAALLKRTFALTARRFRSRLLHLMDDLATGSTDVAGFTRDATKLVRTEFSIAYSLGALSISPFHTLTIRDIRNIDRMIDDEREFLRAFGFDLYHNRLILSPIQRAGLYLQALRGMFEYGRINSLPDGPYTWELGPTEHCFECIGTSQAGPYQRDRFSDLGLQPLPGVPGSGEVCRGLTRCGCRLKLKGVPIPNEDLQRELKDVLADVLHDTS